MNYPMHTYKGLPYETAGHGYRKWWYQFSKDKPFGTVAFNNYNARQLKLPLVHPYESKAVFQGGIHTGERLIDVPVSYLYNSLEAPKCDDATKAEIAKMLKRSVGGKEIDNPRTDYSAMTTEQLYSLVNNRGADQSAVLAQIAQRNKEAESTAEIAEEYEFYRSIPLDELEGYHGDKTYAADCRDRMHEVLTQRRLGASNNPV